MDWLAGDFHLVAHIVLGSDPPASRGGAFGSIASMTRRSVKRMEMDPVPTRSRLPENELPVTNPGAGRTTSRGVIKDNHRLGSRAFDESITSVHLCSIPERGLTGRQSTNIEVALPPPFALPLGH